MPNKEFKAVLHDKYYKEIELCKLFIYKPLYSCFSNQNHKGFFCCAVIKDKKKASVIVK